MTFATSCSTFIKCAVRFPSYHIKRKKKTIVYLNVGTYIQLHYLQVAIATPKGGITILRSLLTDNPPSPGKVGHPTRVYVPSLFSNSGVGSFTFHKNQISESAVRPDLWSLSLSQSIGRVGENPENEVVVFHPNLRRLESLTVCRCHSLQGRAALSS